MFRWWKYYCDVWASVLSSAPYQLSWFQMQTLVLVYFVPCWTICFTCLLVIICRVVARHINAQVDTANNKKKITLFYYVTLNGSLNKFCAYNYFTCFLRLLLKYQMAMLPLCTCICGSLNLSIIAFPDWCTHVSQYWLNLLASSFVKDRKTQTGKATDV